MLLAGAKVLGRVHLHEEEFQVLAGNVLTGKEEVKPIFWPPDYVTSSRVERWVLSWLCSTGAAGPEQVGNRPKYCKSQDSTSWIWTYLSYVAEAIQSRRWQRGELSGDGPVLRQGTQGQPLWIDPC